MHTPPCRYLYTHNYSVSPLTVSAVDLSCTCCCTWHGPCTAARGMAPALLPSSSVCVVPPLTLAAALSANMYLGNTV